MAKHQIWSWGRFYHVLHTEAEFLRGIMKTAGRPSRQTIPGQHEVPDLTTDQATPDFITRSLDRQNVK